MRLISIAPLVAAAAALAAPAAGQEPLIDAGGQAMLMHQGDLLEQQTAPNNDHTGRRRPPSADRRETAGSACSIDAERDRLRPEYERRARTLGRPAADAWLRRQAAELGRSAGERVKAGLPC